MAKSLSRTPGFCIRSSATFRAERSLASRTASRPSGLPHFGHRVSDAILMDRRKEYAPYVAPASTSRKKIAGNAIKNQRKTRSDVYIVLLIAGYRWHASRQ